MCGICAAIDKCALEKVTIGLKKLEYRGYDSSGIAYQKNKSIMAIKSIGPIKNLIEKLKNIKDKPKIVIGHTRWATHGKVSLENAHPHLSQNGKIAIVHNGIIENYDELKRKFLPNTKLRSQTDTEVLACLIEKMDGNTLKKLIRATKLVKGSFALALICAGENKIYLARRNSPLMVSIDGKMAGSDISVFADSQDSAYIFEDDEFAIMDGKSVKFYNPDGKKIVKNPVQIDRLDFEQNLESENFYMMKEIKEQPEVLRKTLAHYLENGFDFDIEKIKNFESFHFIACGTSYHAGLLAAQFFQSICRKPCVASIASEFRYADNILSPKCLYIFISQSGETADTIACARLVKEQGLSAMCITNVPYSSIYKLADFSLPTFAGKEVAVASTKAYTAQVFTMLLLALKMANKLDEKLLKNFVNNAKLTKIDEKMLENVLKFEKIFFIGRQQDYITALEASLKLKEIAYLNCIGIAGGELKHGTLALIDNKTLVIAISTRRDLKEKVENSLEEIKARGGHILLVTNFTHDIRPDFQLFLPDFEEIFMPLISIMPLQLLAFHYSRALGYNPDMPRNLAKSVTVE